MAQAISTYEPIPVHVAFDRTSDVEVLTGLTMTCAHGNFVISTETVR